MNKREVVWLIVRLIGVYFAYSAIVTLFSLAGAVSSLYSLGGDAAVSGRPEIEANRTPIAGFPSRSDSAAVKADPATEKLKSDAFKTVLLYIFLTALYGGLAFYLIRKGGILFAILNGEDSTGRQKDPTVTTLKL